nr:hypothetical protein [Streptomyces mexicanus]
MPAALPGRTRARPVCGEPSGAPQRTFAQTCPFCPTAASGSAVGGLGARCVTRAVVGRHAVRCRASPSAAERAAVHPATTPASTVTSHTPSTTHASTTSQRRRSGLRRHRHSRTRGPRNPIDGFLLISART